MIGSGRKVKQLLRATGMRAQGRIPAHYSQYNIHGRHEYRNGPRLMLRYGVRTMVSQSLRIPKIDTSSKLRSPAKYGASWRYSDRHTRYIVPFRSGLSHKSAAGDVEQPDSARTGTDVEHEIDLHAGIEQVVWVAASQSFGCDGQSDNLAGISELRAQTCSSSKLSSQEGMQLRQFASDPEGMRTALVKGFAAGNEHSLAAACISLQLAALFMRDAMAEPTRSMKMKMQATSDPAPVAVPGAKISSSGRSLDHNQREYETNTSKWRAVPASLRHASIAMQSIGEAAAESIRATAIKPQEDDGEVAAAAAALAIAPELLTAAASALIGIHAVCHALFRDLHSSQSNGMDTWSRDWAVDSTSQARLHLLEVPAAAMGRSMLTVARKLINAINRASLSPSSKEGDGGGGGEHSLPEPRLALASAQLLLFAAASAGTIGVRDFLQLPQESELQIPLGWIEPTDQARFGAWSTLTRLAIGWVQRDAGNKLDDAGSASVPVYASSPGLLAAARKSLDDTGVVSPKAYALHSRPYDGGWREACALAVCKAPAKHMHGGSTDLEILLNQVAAISRMRAVADPDRRSIDEEPVSDATARPSLAAGACITAIGRGLGIPAALAHKVQMELLPIPSLFGNKQDNDVVTSKVIQLNGFDSRSSCVVAIAVAFSAQESDVAVRARIRRAARSLDQCSSSKRVTPTLPSDAGSAPGDGPRLGSAVSDSVRCMCRAAIALRWAGELTPSRLATIDAAIVDVVASSRGLHRGLPYAEAIEVARAFVGLIGGNDDDKLSDFSDQFLSHYALVAAELQLEAHSKGKGNGEGRQSMLLAIDVPFARAVADAAATRSQAASTNNYTSRFRERLVPCLPADYDNTDLHTVRSIAPRESLSPSPSRVTAPRNRAMWLEQRWSKHWVQKVKSVSLQRTKGGRSTLDNLKNRQGEIPLPRGGFISSWDDPGASDAIPGWPSKGVAVHGRTGVASSRSMSTSGIVLRAIDFLQNNPASVLDAGASPGIDNDHGGDIEDHRGADLSEGMIALKRLWSDCAQIQVATGAYASDIATDAVPGDVEACTDLGHDAIELPNAGAAAGWPQLRVSVRTCDASQGTWVRTRVSQGLEQLLGPHRSSSLRSMVAPSMVAPSTGQLEATQGVQDEDLGEHWKWVPPRHLLGWQESLGSFGWSGIVLPVAGGNQETCASPSVREKGLEGSAEQQANDCGPFLATACESEHARLLEAIASLAIAAESESE